MIRKFATFVLALLYLAATTGFAVYNCRCSDSKQQAEHSCCKQETKAPESCCGNNCGAAESTCNKCNGGESKCAEYKSVKVQAEVLRSVKINHSIDFTAMLAAPSVIEYAAAAPCITFAANESPPYTRNKTPVYYSNCQLRL